MGDDDGIHRPLRNGREIRSGAQTIDLRIRPRIKNDIFAPDTQPVTI